MKAAIGWIWLTFALISAILTSIMGDWNTETSVSVWAMTIIANVYLSNTDKDESNHRI